MTSVTEPVLLGPYNEQVRGLFQNPRHTGDAAAGNGRRYEARASESTAGAQILLIAGVTEGILAALRFRVFGCPHLIAAAEATCERFEGGAVNKLQEFNVSDLMETLGVPVEKMGRILLLEDAIQALLSQVDGKAINRN